MVRGISCWIDAVLALSHGGVAPIELALSGVAGKFDIKLRCNATSRSNCSRAASDKSSVRSAYECNGFACTVALLWLAILAASMSPLNESFSWKEVAKCRCSLRAPSLEGQASDIAEAQMRAALPRPLATGTADNEEER